MQVEVEIEVECRMQLTTRCATQFEMQLATFWPVLSDVQCEVQ
jgi:hypothetical protein